MNEVVRVEVNTTHRYSENEIESFVSKGEGKYFHKRDFHYIEYKVIEEGVEVRYLLKLGINELSLTKTSPSGRYMMELWENGKTKFNYQTTYGIVPVHIEVKSLHINVRDSLIEVDAVYDLLQDENQKIECKMDIEICSIHL